MAYYPQYYVSPYDYNSMTDSGITPLSYIKATTPEYTDLQSQYQAIQQQLAQSQAENQQLQQKLQDTQRTMSQQSSTIADLNQQLSSAKTMNGELEAVSLGLAALIVVLAIAGVLYSRRKSKTAPEKTTVDKPNINE